jgi:galactitol-specific phosphotransferase system IIB component
LKESGGRLDNLIPKSRRPKRVRTMKVNSEIVTFIRDIREKHPRIGKEKIKKFLDEYCSKKEIKSISVSAIGKIIKGYDLTFAPTKLNYHRKRMIKHNFIYPRCPRINGFIERANRTLQEEFIDLHLNLLLEDIDEFNRRLMDYLLWYNTERPHKSLNNLTPMDFLH